jgi:hypothetical protein
MLTLYTASIISPPPPPPPSFSTPSFSPLLSELEWKDICQAPVFLHPRYEELLTAPFIFHLPPWLHRSSIPVIVPEKKSKGDSLSLSDSCSSIVPPSSHPPLPVLLLPTSRQTISRQNSTSRKNSIAISRTNSYGTARSRNTPHSRCDSICSALNAPMFDEMTPLERRLMM